MPTAQRDDTFDMGADVLGTTQAENGAILAQTGDVVGEEVFSENVEIWGPLGLAARPAKADAGKAAAQCIAIKQGTNDVAIAYRDLRASSCYCTLREGETCLYAPGPSNSGTSRLLLQNDGSSTTAKLEAAAVLLGAAAAEGVVCGGSAFTAWTSAVTGALHALITAVATKAAVNGSPIDPSVSSAASGLDFPTAEISTVVKAAT